MRLDKSDFYWEQTPFCNWLYTNNKDVVGALYHHHNNMWEWEIYCYLDGFDQQRIIASGSGNSLPFNVAKETAEYLLYQYGVIY